MSDGNTTMILTQTWQIYLTSLRVNISNLFGSVQISLKYSPPCKNSYDQGNYLYISIQSNVYML